MNRWRNVLRYGRRFNHVFQVGTHEIATATEQSVRDFGEGYSTTWDNNSDGAGLLNTGKKLVTAFRHGLPADKFSPLKLPESLTSATRPTQEMVRRPSGPLWNPGLCEMGHPRPAYSFKNLDDGRAKVARIAVSWISSADMPPAWMERRGKALAALLGALKRADFEVELRALYMGQVHHRLQDLNATTSHKLLPPEEDRAQRGESVCIDMPVHYPGKHLDPNRIATVLGQKGSIQKGLWPWRGKTFGVAWFSGLDTEEKDVEQYFLEQGWIYIPSLYHDPTGGKAWKSDSDAVAWIAKTLHGFGVMGSVEE